MLDERRKTPLFSLSSSYDNYDSREIVTGREMCEREEIAEEGENGDLEKRSATDLA